MSMFYLGQWGGGDAKIMMALGTLLGFEFSAHYFSVAFLVNIILVGAMYGIAWSCYIATQHWAKFLKTSKRLLKDKTYFLLKILSAGIAVVLISISFFVQYSHQKTGLIILGAGIFLFFYLYIFVKAIEECCMFKLVKPTKLSEGDWIAEKITYKNRIIAQPKDLGIGQRQINKLVKLYEQGKIRRVKIKEGMPFVPNFFLAYVVTFFWGNVILSLI
jgi:prepilin signal peptidase PulO-like enzyme (type II secretory pathway)